MREGWEYKKYQWSDVLTIINGKNQSAVVNPDGEYPIYGSGGIMGYADDYLCPENCVVIGRKGNINKPLFVDTRFWNVDTAFGLSANDKYLSPRYLYYFCLDYNFEKHNKAVTIPSLTKADLLKINIDLPSVKQQLTIVSELDKINELIRLKKEQLKDYDNLAQSIFYEMFGDPVENEMGWESKSLEAIYKFIDYRGKTPNKIDFGIPLITARNVRYGYLDYTVKDYISETEYKERQSRGIARKGDLLFSTEAPLGYAAIADLEEFSTGQRLIALQKTIMVENKYVLYYILSPFFQEQLKRQATGSTAQGIKASKLKALEVYLPPLPLQQTFASRITQIEAQKAEVQRALTDLETLLASRMQYWFD